MRQKIRAWLLRHPFMPMACVALVMAGSCPFAPGGGDLAGSNAYWNAPTPSPPPPPTPIPTVCVQGTPNPLGTPGPDECSKPIPTWTPLASPTPHGIWLSPGDKGTSGTFYLDQDVRIGPLRMTLTAYAHSAAIPGTSNVAHVWTFDTQNEAGRPITITWPLQTFVREIADRSGTTTAGTWWETSKAEQAAGIPRYDPGTAAYQPGQHKTITVAIEGPAGTAHAVGFLPDPTGGEMRQDLAAAPHVIWFIPSQDPYADGNTSGPARQGDGGATYGKPLGTPRPALYGYFSGWPVNPNGSSVLSQGFGCTDFHEISGFNCPNDKPWFHSGIDIADPSRPLLYSTVHGRVTYVGVSPGRACSFSGAEDPKTNLGWMIQIQVIDDTGHIGPYTVKYGHTAVGRQQVNVGDEVVPGQILTRMASTGCSTGAHVHFMVQNPAGTFLDPFNFIGENRK